MRAVLALLLAIVFMSGPAAPAASARGRHARATAVRATGAGAKVAVQPFEGPGGAAVRAQIARIVRGRGFRVVTTLPRYEGTAQYPALARDHRLAAFVTGDVEERGRWQTVTFLVWNGADGSVIGRWSASAPARSLLRTVGRGFWRHVGPAMLTSAPPPSSTLAPAPPMRIDAAASDEPVAID